MKRNQFLALSVAVATVFVFAPAAEAGGSWGGGSSGGFGSSGGSWGGSSGGSWGDSGGSWGGSSGDSSGGGSWGGSSGGSSGRVGPLRRMAAKIHERKAARHAARHSGGSSGGGSWGGGSSGGGSWGGGSSGGQMLATSFSGGSSGGSSGGGWSGGSSGGGWSGGSSGGGWSGGSSGGGWSNDAAFSYDSGFQAPLYSENSSVIDPSFQQYEYQEYGLEGTNAISASAIGGQVLESAIVPAAGDSLGDSVVDSAPYEAAKPAVDADAAMLTVSVPEDAVVTVNDHRTTSDGTLRQFMSQGLEKGYVYTYVVKATFAVDGEEKTETKEVKLRAGEREELAFGQSADEPEAPAAGAVEASDETAQVTPTDNNGSATADVVTVVRLHVPADAKVTLAGNPTRGTGAIRTFRTHQLSAGEQWTSYTVVVEAEVGGQAVTQERTLNVAAGSVNELTFEFEDSTDSIARR